MKTVRFGVLSARSRGAYMAMIYNQHPNAKVVAIADPDPTAFDDGQERFARGGITDFRKYHDPSEMLEKEKGNVDWIIVASPDHTHFEMTIKALKAGYHVFIEKPMCQTIEQADEIDRASAETGKNVVVGCELRYAQPVISFRELLRGGTIGRILHGYCVDSVEVGFTFFLRDYRKKKWATNLLLQKGVHSIDLINDFVGAEPVRVYADGGLDYFGQDPKAAGKYCRDCEEKNTCPDSAYRVPSWKGKFMEKGEHARDHCVYDPASDVEDNTIVIINYANGVRVSYNEIQFSPEYKREFHFIGTDGRASLVLDQTTYRGKEVDIQAEGRRVILTITKRNQVTQRIETPLPSGSHWGGDHLMRDALVAATLKGESIHPDAAGGRAAMAIGYAAEKSVQAGVPVAIAS